MAEVPVLLLQEQLWRMMQERLWRVLRQLEGEVLLLVLKVLWMVLLPEELR